MKTIRNHIFLQIALFAFLAFSFSGCRLTRYLPDNKSLLYKSKVKGDIQQFNQQDINNCIVQKPNSIFSVWIFSQANPSKNNWFAKTIRSFGEEPIVYNPENAQRSMKQLKRYFEKKGYFNTVISDSIVEKNRKIWLTYNIKCNNPYTINHFSYNTNDSNINKLLLNDSINCQIKNNVLFDEDIFTSERIRLENHFLNSGYFNFNRDYIIFDVDTSIGNKKANVVIKINNPESKNYSKGKHLQYKIQNVFYRTDKATFETQNSSINLADTIILNNIHFIYNERPVVKAKALIQQNFITPGSLFNLYDIEKTKKRLSALNVYNVINTNQFTENSVSDTSKFGSLNCNIQLIPANLQSYAWEVEGTTSEGDIGGALNIIYQHHSLLRKAENFNLKLIGALGTTTRSNFDSLQRILEYGIETSLNFPKFLLPFRSESFTLKYNPRTNISFSYSYHERPSYTYYQTNTTFGYIWKSREYITNTVNPIELNLVNVRSIDSALLKTWSANQQNHFKNHIVSAISYSFEYKNQNIRNSDNYNYLKYNIEASGNGLSAINKIANAPKKDSHYTLFNIQYSQYIKTDIEYRHFWITNNKNGIAARIFAGIAYPYGNNNVIFFEKQYFAGGPNSLRGWNEQTLGPGSYSDTLGSINNQYVKADIKLEANIEYRYKLFWILENAFFIDAGNIWAINEADYRKVFHSNTFYKEIAVSAGTGIRFNLNFLIIRFDTGIKIHSPSENFGSKWIFERKKIKSKDYSFGIAIGYPF